MRKMRNGVISGFLIAASTAVAVALAPAPAAEVVVAAPLLPQCVVTGAGGGMQGGQTTLCEEPGNAQLDSRPSMYPPMGAGGMGMGFFPWFGFFP